MLVKKTSNYKFLPSILERWMSDLKKKSTNNPSKVYHCKKSSWFYCKNIAGIEFLQKTKGDLTYISGCLHAFLSDVKHDMTWPYRLATQPSSFFFEKFNKKRILVILEMRLSQLNLPLFFPCIPGNYLFQLFKQKCLQRRKKHISREFKRKRDRNWNILVC